MCSEGIYKTVWGIQKVPHAKLAILTIITMNYDVF